MRKPDTSNRTTSKALETLGGVRIEIGRIVNIYPQRGTVDFRSEMSEQYRYDIPYALPYFDQVGGAGIYFNPEVGTTALCITTSEDRSLILAFIGVDEEGSYLCGRPQGNPGDILITGRDNNFLAVRRGGIVQIGSGPICQSVYIPTRNIIQNFCENFELYSLAGTMKFNVNRPEDNSDGHSKVLFSLDVNEFADDKGPIASLDIGSQSNNVIFSLITKDKGDGTTKITLTGDKSGNLSLSLEQNLKIVVKGDTKIETTGKTTITSKDDISMDSSANLKLHGSTTSMKADTTAEVVANGILTLKGSTTKISDRAMFPVLRMSPDMATLIGACVAITKVPPPTQGVNPTVLV